MKYIYYKTCYYKTCTPFFDRLIIIELKITQKHLNIKNSPLFMKSVVLLHWRCLAADQSEKYRDPGRGRLGRS